MARQFSSTILASEQHKYAAGCLIEKALAELLTQGDDMGRAVVELESTVLRGQTLSKTTQTLSRTTTNTNTHREN